MPFREADQCGKRLCHGESLRLVAADIAVFSLNVQRLASVAEKAMQASRKAFHKRKLSRLADISRFNFAVRSQAMPITPYLNGAGNFDAEALRVMGVAFEMARAAIQRDWGDYANGTLAKLIIELAKAGETNPDVLCERALSTFRSRQNI